MVTYLHQKTKQVIPEPAYHREWSPSLSRVAILAKTPSQLLMPKQQLGPDNYKI